MGRPKDPSKMRPLGRVLDSIYKRRTIPGTNRPMNESFLGEVIAEQNLLPGRGHSRHVLNNASRKGEDYPLKTRQTPDELITAIEEALAYLDQPLLPYELAALEHSLTENAREIRRTRRRLQESGASAI